jgi:hypothetical protein
MYRLLILALLVVSCNQQEVKKPIITNNEVTPTPKDPVEKLGKSVISIDSLKILINKFDHLKGFKPAINYPTVSILGDFYGDGIKDIAVLTDNGISLDIVVFNFNKKLQAHIIGTGNDKTKSNFYFSEIFSAVKPGEILWSNYDKDYIRFEDVPEKDKVKLSYDAIFIHFKDKCGGGFIYWKNGAFHWLDQF